MNWQPAGSAIANVKYIKSLSRVFMKFVVNVVMKLMIKTVDSMKWRPPVINNNKGFPYSKSRKTF